MLQSPTHGLAGEKKHIINSNPVEESVDYCSQKSYISGKLGQNNLLKSICIDELLIKTH